MAITPSTSHESEKQPLRDYLLGRMPEDAAAEVDERLFESNVLLDELEEERQWLIEDFVGGRLTAEEGTLFRSQMARSPELRKKTDDFREFLVALQRVADSSAKFKAFSQIFLILSPALALLLCVVSLLYVKELHRNAELHSKLSAGQQATQLQAHAYAGAQSLATAFLSANVTRESSAPLEILVPANVSTLELQIELRDPPSDAKDWKVEVLSGNEVLWQSAHAALRRAGLETFLTAFVNAQDLRPGPYQIRYSPSSNPGAFQTRLFAIRQGR